MADIRTWSTTAASNNSASPDGFPEGMAPSGVNDSAREVMAAVKSWYLQAFTHHITGLTLSNAGADGDHDIVIAVGAAMDTGAADIMQLTSALTKRIDAAWAVGSGNGGIDTGAVGADTMYAVWLIQRSDTYAVDALFSTAFTFGSVTKPTNYDRGQLIGSVCTDSSSNIISFFQVDDYFEYTGDTIADISDSSLTDVTYETGQLSVPPSALAHVVGYYNGGTGASDTVRLFLRYPGGGQDIVAAQEAFLSVQHTSVSGSSLQLASRSGWVLVDSARQIQYGADIVSAVGDESIEVRTIGFRMLTRGKGT